MGQDRKYISIRLYSVSVPKEVPEDREAGSDIHYTSGNMGSSRFSIRTKSELAQSDRLFFHPHSRYSYFSLLIQIMAVGIFLTALWEHIHSWKGAVLFVLGLIIGVAFVVKLIWPDTMKSIQRFVKR